MEDNRNFATFFADAPKGKKIGAVLSWIATAILLVALFVPGFQMNFEKRTKTVSGKRFLKKQMRMIMKQQRKAGQ